MIPNERPMTGKDMLAAALAAFNFAGILLIMNIVSPSLWILTPMIALIAAFGSFVFYEAIISDERTK